MERHDPDGLSTIEYAEQSRMVLVKPLLDGDVRVHILDLCLLTESPTDSLIHISGAHSISLQVRDKVGYTIVCQLLSISLRTISIN